MAATVTTTVRSVVDLNLDPDPPRERVRAWKAERIPPVEALTKREWTLKPQFEQWVQCGATLTADAN
jgi:hypothetical protein